MDLVLELLFPFLGLLSCNLKLLHVLTNSLKFLLNISQLALSQFSTLIGSLQFILLDAQFPCQLIELLFISLAILVVSLRFLSASSISTSFLMVLFSKYLTFLRMPSASLEAMASFVTVSAKLVSAFLASSSINMIRLDKALTSSSAFLKDFSFSSRAAKALVNLSLPM